MRKWGDFSSSQSKPLFWALIAPLLALLTVCASLPHFCDFFSLFIVVCGFLLIWKWGLTALLTTLCLFATHIGLQFFLSIREVTMSNLLCFFSFSLALFIFFCSIKEVKEFYDEQKKSKDQSILELRHSLHHLNEKKAREKGALKSEIKTLQNQLQEGKNEIKALLQLVDASQLESEKTHRQNQNLVQESLKQHRRSKRLELQTDQSLAELKSVKKERDDLARQADSRLKKLNYVRMERAQIQLLFDAAGTGGKKSSSHILSLVRRPSHIIPSSPLASATQEKTDLFPHEKRLQKLKRDQEMAKGVYVNIQKNYQALLLRLRKATKNEKEAMQVSGSRLLSQLKDTKSNLISIEREIFVCKKRMQEEGLQVS